MHHCMKECNTPVSLGFLIARNTEIGRMTEGRKLSYSDHIHLKVMILYKSASYIYIYKIHIYIYKI